MTNDHIGSFDELPAEQPFPGISRKTFNTIKSTVTRYSFEPGAAFPLHRHPQEQITMIEAGTVEFIHGDESGELTAGSYFLVAPEIEHSIKAGPDGATILAVVIPGRENSDAYEVLGSGPTSPDG